MSRPPICSTSVEGTADDAIGQHVKVRDVIRLVEQDGWYFVGQRGSHRQYRHPTKSGKVTVAGKPSDEMAVGTLGSIFSQAGIDRGKGSR